jgi:hypothetical protein
MLPETKHLVTTFEEASSAVDKLEELCQTRGDREDFSNLEHIQKEYQRLSILLDNYISELEERCGEAPSRTPRLDLKDAALRVKSFLEDDCFLYELILHNLKVVISGPDDPESIKLSDEETDLADQIEEVIFENLDKLIGGSNAKM